MLVLSRRHREVIRFPELGINIEILQIKGSSVRVGVDAPARIRIVRGELEPEGQTNMIREFSLPRSNEHEYRNQLNSLAIASALTRKLIQSGRIDEACQRLEDSLQQLEQPGNRDTRQAWTALLVEDTANEREMLAGFLRLHGYQVETVRDGLEAIAWLEAADQQVPELILMDMNMPHCDGPTTIRRIRENPAWSDILIFAVSGLTPGDVGLDPERDRVTRWFQKPLQPADLISAINQLAKTTAA